MPSVILAGTTTGTALSLTSDTSGELQIRTNNGSTTAMTLTTGGNVGVGTTTPATRLHVSGTSALDFIIDTTNANGTRMEFRRSGTVFTYFGDGGSIIGSGSVGSTALVTVGANPLLLGTNGTERMRIDSSGNVAIGTTNTSGARLTVRGAGTTSATASFEAATSGGNTRFYVQDDGTTRFFGSSNSETMRVASDGNVGIGTASPSTPLNIVRNAAGAQKVLFSNNSSGSSAETAFSVSNGTAEGSLRVSGGSYAGYGAYTANNTLVYNDTSAITIMADNASNGIIKFATGGNSERMRITSGGNLLVGTTAAIQDERLAVVGGNGIFCRTQYSITSTARYIAVGTGLLLLLRDDNQGSTALVLYENANTPVIISQSGPTRFVTGAPSGTQIQIANGATSTGVSAQTASGQSTTLNVCVISCDGN